MIIKHSGCYYTDTKRQEDIEMAKKAVPTQMLLDGAQMSLYGFIAGTIGFLKKKKIPVKDWIDYIGDNFSESWGDLKGEKPDFVMEHLLALEVLPMGAEMISSRSIDGKVESTLTTLPGKGVLEKFGTTPRDLLEGFGVTQKDFETVYAMYEPAAKAIGLNFSHRIEDGHEVLTLEKTPKSLKRVVKTK
jgi:hypothetical protein